MSRREVPVSASAEVRRRQDAQRAYRETYGRLMREGKGHGFATGKAKYAYSRVMSAPRSMAEILEQVALEQALDGAGDEG
jgi:hypothetical protein